LKSYSELLNNLTDLILQEKNRNRKVELRHLHRELSDKMQGLVDKNIESDNEKYQVLLTRLEEANLNLQKALKKSQQIEETFVVLNSFLEFVREFT
jgi:hypothetical protein